MNLIVGPVFPHEVVGFSGGNKYFFPGCSVHDVIDISHWVGALITASDIIGTLGITPVRQLIDTAADMIPGEKLAVTYVATSGEDEDDSILHSVAYGDTRSAWAANAQVASRTHITWLDRPYPRIVSKVPEMYEDLWTGAKGVYKMEPVCADGGEIILQKAVDVLPDDTPEVLQRRIMEECEWKLLPQAVSLFCQDRLKVEGRTVRIL